MPVMLSSVPSLLALIQTDLNEIQIKAPQAPLNDFFSSFKKSLDEFGTAHNNDPDTILFRAQVIEMIHEYLESIKKGDLKDADKKLKHFIANYPEPNLSLRRTLYWITASLLILSIVLLPIPFGLYVSSFFFIGFIPSLFALGLFGPASFLEVEIVENHARDFNKHTTTESIYASVRSLASFFKPLDQTLQDEIRVTTLRDNKAA